MRHPRHQPLLSACVPQQQPSLISIEVNRMTSFATSFSSSDRCLRLGMKFPYPVRRMAKINFPRRVRLRRQVTKARPPSHHGRQRPQVFTRVHALVHTALFAIQNTDLTPGKLTAEESAARLMQQRRSAAASSNRSSTVCLISAVHSIQTSATCIQDYPLFLPNHYSRSQWLSCA